MSPRTPPADQAHREAARTARGVNLLVDAGAGTGKTTLLVRRLVELVAPDDDSVAALPLSRLAAVTFTRKAAGELRLRVRERLLSELAARPSALRRERLSAALAEADTAFIGTIHGFADRLLRRRPVEARLSPSYEVVEEAGELLAETFALLLQAVEAGTLPEALAETACPPERAKEAQEHLQLALDAELRRESQELDWLTRHGLQALVEGFILHRDVPPPEVKAARFMLADLRSRLDAFHDLARRSRGNGRGSRWMLRTAAALARLLEESDPARLFAELSDLAARSPGKLGMAKDFPGDAAGWEAWKAWIGNGTDSHRDAILRPLHRWLATRLVRCFPAVVAMYEQVKARHRAVDQVDLLLRLRDLLRDDTAVRGEYQGLFDHVFVDEFQDTDPLQAEILLYLCEGARRARRWQDVTLAPGRLTLVGDPKQSIYRFRRADISVYEAVRAIVMKGPHLRVPLTANFRTEPRLIDHLNERFDALLGTAAAGTDGFDAVTGTVANQRLDAGREGTRERCVAVLPFAAAEARADEERSEEARVLATWLRAQVDGGALNVVDPVTESPRPVRFGDVAILAHSTSSVGKVIDELDRLGVPWSARGGTLFLDDPLHRRFLLALRALADREDGVAQAALLRAPFFSIDLRDLVRARAAGDAPGDVGVERARAALALVTELRRERLARPPGATARDLLERTGLARAVAFGANGLQRLERLRELCFELERLAAAEGLDYDGATARLRAWALEAVPLDPPRPVGGDAVQLMTIHQAKGLEFPVVAWWDSNAKVAPRDRTVPWFVSHTGDAWSISLDGLGWAEPEGDDVLARERSFLAAERRRLVYVAATRARDLLVLPVAGELDEDFVADALVGDPKSPAVYLEEAWGPGVVPTWARRVVPPKARAPRTAKKLEALLAAAWAEAAEEAARPRSSPVGVSTEAHRVAEEASDEAGARWKERPSRFGPVFGDTVHRAIGLALAEPALGAEGAVARAALVTGLAERRAEAVTDVTRALEALEREGLRRPPGGDLRLEYPVAAPGEGTLLLGYLDLLAVRGDEVLVLDFKTDAPPAGDVHASHPDYVAQVRAYERILVELGVARPGKVRGCLLFTADGVVRWV